MARKIQVLLTCDFDDDDAPAVETVVYTYDGVTYAFEACQAHLDEFAATMDGFVTHSRREAAGGRSRNGAPAAAAARPVRAAAREDLSSIREWARGKGFQVSDRGRIPAEIRHAYEAASKR
jgi:hypothetical protein